MCPARVPFADRPTGWPQDRGRKPKGLIQERRRGSVSPFGVCASRTCFGMCTRRKAADIKQKEGRAVSPWMGFPPWWNTFQRGRLGKGGPGGKTKAGETACQEPPAAFSINGSFPLGRCGSGPQRGYGGPCVCGQAVPFTAGLDPDLASG